MRCGRDWEKMRGSYKERKAAINATYKNEVAEAKAKNEPFRNKTCDYAREE